MSAAHLERMGARLARSDETPTLPRAPSRALSVSAGAMIGRRAFGSFVQGLCATWCGASVVAVGEALGRRLGAVSAPVTTRRCATLCNAESARV
jgi:hypothetical protein